VRRGLLAAGGTHTAGAGRRAHMLLLVDGELLLAAGADAGAASVGLSGYIQQAREEDGEEGQWHQVPTSLIRAALPLPRRDQSESKPRCKLRFLQVSEGTGSCECQCVIVAAPITVHPPRLY
jgi:hypothetical protein